MPANDLITTEQAGEIIANVVNLCNDWWGPIIIFSYLFGFCVLVIGIINLAKSSQRTGQGFYMPMMAIITGIFLLNLPAILNVVSHTFFDNNPTSNFGLNGLSYQASSGSDITKLFLVGAFALFSVVGLFSIARGVYMLYTSSTQQSQNSFVGALIHIIAGVFLINLDQFLRLFGKSMGSIVESSISGMLDIL